jgi:hypothetical protein
MSATKTHRSSNPTGNNNGRDCNRPTSKPTMKESRTKLLDGALEAYRKSFRPFKWRLVNTIDPLTRQKALRWVKTHKKTFQDRVTTLQKYVDGKYQVYKTVACGMVINEGTLSDEAIASKEIKPHTMFRPKQYKVT